MDPAIQRSLQDKHAPQTLTLPVTPKRAGSAKRVQSELLTPDVCLSLESGGEEADGKDVEKLWEQRG